LGGLRRGDGRTVIIGPVIDHDDLDRQKRLVIGAGDRAPDHGGAIASRNNDRYRRCHDTRISLPPEQSSV
jgi:hypothetical protein